MKKKIIIIAAVMCAVIFSAALGCVIGIKFVSDNKHEQTITFADEEVKDANTKDTENKTKSTSKKSKKERLSQGGVNYLVNDGKLIISGNGTVTTEAIAALSPEYNIVDFESGEINIADNVFNGCTDITKVYFRNTVRDIGERAFMGTSLGVVCFGSSIGVIGEEAFTDCCIDYVFINNEFMYQNFNSRYDFGEVALTAENVYVYKDLMPMSDINNIKAGDYLAQSELYTHLKKAVANHTTFGSQSYAYSTYIDDGFMTLYGLRVGNWMTIEYTPETNMFTYSFHMNTELPWKDRSVTDYVIKSEEEDDMPKATAKPVATANASKSAATKANSGTSKAVNSTKDAVAERGKSCSICGGTGSKQCTSCHGQGSYYEYDNYGVMDGGKLTKIRKTCQVCHGSGKVKCYH